MKKFRKIIANDIRKCYYLINKEMKFMIIEYKVKNFKSFKNEIILSMVADNNRELSDTNLFQYKNMTLLKSAAIFGSNASGKSNLIESFSFFNDLFSAYVDINKMLSNLPYFKLDTESKNKPISYEISFFLNGKRHRYGIEIDSKEFIQNGCTLFLRGKRHAILKEKGMKSSVQEHILKIERHWTI